MAMLAQLVEQRIVIPWVSGSIPLHRPNEVFGPILWDWLFLCFFFLISHSLCALRVFLLILQFILSNFRWSRAIAPDKRLICRGNERIIYAAA